MAHGHRERDTDIETRSLEPTNVATAIPSEPNAVQVIHGRQSSAGPADRPTEKGGPCGPPCFHQKRAPGMSGGVFCIQPGTGADEKTRTSTPFPALPPQGNFDGAKHRQARTLPGTTGTLWDYQGHIFGNFCRTSATDPWCPRGCRRETRHRVKQKRAPPTRGAVQVGGAARRAGRGAR